MLTHANAYPRKRFFLDMFTRDISVEDCLLDLIDNSIDALIRTRGIDLSSLWDLDCSTPAHASPPAAIDLEVSDKRICLADKCGGIPEEIIEFDLFGMGHTEDYQPGALGAYGVGLKRALFKLGGHFDLKSRTTRSGFQAKLDVAEWAEAGEHPDAWQVPITELKAVRHLAAAGTTITVTELHQEVSQRLQNPQTENRLRANIAQAYALFLGRYVQVSVNDELVEKMELPFGKSEDVTPGKDSYEDDGVKVTLMVSLASRDASDEWPEKRAGWYVFCNGRLVVAADKSDLTGWDAGLPQWHSKYRGFVGAVFFESDKPLDLPWTTTKRGINRESLVFQRARDQMILLATPVCAFLARMYPSEPKASVVEREVAERVEPTSVRTVAARSSSPFSARQRRQRPRTTVNVQFTAPLESIEKVKDRLAKPNWGARKVGLYCLDYFVERECP